LLYFKANGDKLETPAAWICEAANDAACLLLGVPTPRGLSLNALLPDPGNQPFFDTILGSSSGGQQEIPKNQAGAWLMAGGQRTANQLAVTLTDITRHKEAAIADMRLLEFTIERATRKYEIDIRDAGLLQLPDKGSAALQALKDSEEKYRSIFEYSIDVIYLLDAKGRFTDINDSATQLLGFSKEELLGRKITDIFVDEAAKLDFLKRLSQKENMSDFETEIIISSGERRFYIIACTYYHPPGTEKHYFQGILHDITRRKKAEQELLIVEKLAATGRIVRMLGHEIRNPLTNIDLAINQLNTSNEELKDYIEIIQRNSKRISQLLTDLLQISIPGRLDFKPCAPGAILDLALDMAADRISLKSIRLEKSYDANAPVINADEDKLKVAFLNIILNAVEAMEEGKGVLQVKTSGQDDGCWIKISDNGPGIAGEHISHIFEPYFSRKPKGLGLGLSGTLNIVQSHRGRMEVESNPGKGATFLVWLPV